MTCTLLEGQRAHAPSREGDAADLSSKNVRFELFLTGWGSIFSGSLSFYAATRGRPSRDGRLGVACSLWPRPQHGQKAFTGIRNATLAIYIPGKYSTLQIKTLHLNWHKSVFPWQRYDKAVGKRTKKICAQVTVTAFSSKSTLIDKDNFFTAEIISVLTKNSN